MTVCLVGKTAGMAIETVLFDLDGTLLDSAPGIRRCANESLRHHGLPPLTDEHFSTFIGPPLSASFGSLVDDAATIESLIFVYREHYAAGGMHEYTVYEGVAELLRQLNDAGYRLGVATSKVARFAIPVVEHAGLHNQFEIVVGAESDGDGARKSVVMADALDRFAVTDPKTVMMIGDRNHDAYGAKTTGTEFIGVSWGFGTKAELEKAGALRIAAHPSEVATMMQELA
ncbi:MAG: HAD hydrolase-like protein [Acidimicrobiales bacterium]